MRTQDTRYIHSLQEHVAAIARLDPDALTSLRELAAQLSTQSVRPFIGAGGSRDCGMLLARDIGAELESYYKADARFDPHVDNLAGNLGYVADEIKKKLGQRGVVEALGLSDEALWPPAREIGDHFCGYRVMARLSREGLFDDAFSLNYDCCYEAGLHREGFLLAPDTRRGKAFLDHVTVKSDHQTGTQTTARGSMVLRKAHGCAQRYREEVAKNPAGAPEDAIVVRYRQILEWRDKLWAREQLRSAATENVLLLVGFSGQDPHIVTELTSVLSEVTQAANGNGNPRVIVLDHNADAPPLDALVTNGLGDADLAPDKAAKVKTGPNSTVTAALIVLLTELLTVELADAFSGSGYTLPRDLVARITTLISSAPAMLRWSYLLRSRQDDHSIQRANFHQAAKRDGYVPLTDAPGTTAKTLRRRAELRSALGLSGDEDLGTVETYHGWLVHRFGGKAYMPTGLDTDDLRQACGVSGGLADARHVLKAPPGLECILVGDGRRGFTLTLGKEVPVP